MSEQPQQERWEYIMSPENPLDRVGRYIEACSGLIRAMIRNYIIGKKFNARYDEDDMFQEISIRLARSATFLNSTMDESDANSFVARIVETTAADLHRYHTAEMRSISSETIFHNKHAGYMFWQDLPETFFSQKIPAHDITWTRRNLGSVLYNRHVAEIDVNEFIDNHILPLEYGDEIAQSIYNMFMNIWETGKPQQEALAEKYGVTSRTLRRRYEQWKKEVILNYGIDLDGIIARQHRGQIAEIAYDDDNEPGHRRGVRDFSYGGKPSNHLNI